jgi:hypothetical protein
MVATGTAVVESGLSPPPDVFLGDLGNTPGPMAVLDAVSSILLPPAMAATMHVVVVGGGRR